MNTIDLLLLAVIGVSALLGLMRGFIGVLASLVAWLLAGWIAFRYGGQVAVAIAGDGQPGAGELFAGYGLSFLVVMVFVALVAWLVRKLVHAVGLSGVDRALGFAVGVVRGAFVACVIVLLMGFTTMPQDGSWRESRVVPVLMPGSQWLQGWLPHWAAGEVDLGRQEPHLSSPGNAPALPAPAGA
jgi:membrane protein required for colicin V production